MRNSDEWHKNLTAYVLIILMVASLLMLALVSEGQDASAEQRRSVKVCHRVAESPNTTYELIIDRSDLNIHLDHGDYMGVCKEEKAESYIDVRIVPNPYFEKTEIRYVLTCAASVQLIIYDQIGNKVVTLVDENQVPGSYSIEFNGKSICYAPGVHILKFLRVTNDVSSVVYKRLMEIH